jgi:hypothetical protein
MAGVVAGVVADVRYKIAKERQKNVASRMFLHVV